MSENFGIYLKDRRKQAGVSQRDLAETMGVDFTYLSKIENGHMPPPSDASLERIVSKLDADRDEVYWIAGKLPPDVTKLLLEAGPAHWRELRRDYGVVA